MIVKVLLQIENATGRLHSEPVEIGAVSGATPAEAMGRLSELFYDLAHHDWSEDHSAESGCGGNCAICQERQALRER